MSGVPNNQEEENRLYAVSIPQQFAWTGLGSRTNDEAATATSTNSNFWLEDLLLWNVLGYAVDFDNYLNLQLVSKEWKRMVLVLEPPSIVQMSRLLQDNDGNAIIEEKYLKLLTDALESLKSRESNVYRKSSTKEAWPTLQPQFNVIMMRFVFALMTQRYPYNFSSQVHESCREFLESLAKSTVSDFRNCLLQNDEPLHLLGQLLIHWRSWEGVVNTVHDVANYLNRFYVRHHDLPDLKQDAQSRLASHLLDSLGEEAIAAAILDLLTKLSTMTQLSAEGRALLLQGWRACQKLRTFSWPRRAAPPVAGMMQIREEYHRLEATLASSMDLARQEEKEEASRIETSTKVKQQQDIVIVTTFDNCKFSLGQNCHFINSSGFLTRLHLVGGDTVHLDSSASKLEKAMRFYQLDEANPMREFVFIPDEGLQAAVGEVYDNYVSSMDETELFEMVCFANLMDLPKLLDLCCAAIATMVQGRSAEEIITLFNLPTDVGPEEEAQIRMMDDD